MYDSILEICSKDKNLATQCNQLIQKINNMVQLQDEIKQAKEQLRSTNKKKEQRKLNILLELTIIFLKL